MIDTLTDQLLVVAAGALFTALLAGALLYWIVQEHRDLRDRQPSARDAAPRAQPPDHPDNPAPSSRMPGT